MDDSMAWWDETLTVGVRSDVGRVRAQNEDSYGIFEGVDGERLFIVADGMGGHAAGEEASRLAVAVIHEAFIESRDSPVEDRLRAAFSMANQRVYEYSNGRPRGTMGTTCTALAVSREGVLVGHAGDSRLYRITDDAITQVTRDHTVAADLEAAGIITHEEARRHPRRHALTRAVGVAVELEVDVLEEPAPVARTRYLICSDGLLVVPIEDMERVARHAPPQQACDELVRRANARGGPDNITVMVIAFQ